MNIGETIDKLVAWAKAKLTPFVQGCIIGSIATMIALWIV